MTDIQEIEMVASPGGEDAQGVLAGSHWFTTLRRLRLAETPRQGRTEEEEICLLILTGTHDLQVGGGQWIGRGLRETPYEGRPVSIFMPPSTPHEIAGGRGEVLLIGSRRPERPEASGHEQLSRKPLLQMAGSGKAFDPAAGEWKPQESFPNSPEAILPRRIEQVTAAGALVQRVFPLAYKALSLTVDEVVLEDGACFDLQTLTTGPHPEELLIYCRCEGAVELEPPGTSWRGTGESAVLVARDPDQPLPVTSRGGRAYLAVAGAGLKPDLEQTAAP